MRMRRLKWAEDYLKTSPSRMMEPEKGKGRWKRKLKTDGALHVEIGAGKGSYSHDMAKMNPEDGFIAIEKNESAAGMISKKYDESPLPNLKMIYGDATDLRNWFQNREADIIHLNFSDPWPKRRNAKRRLSSPAFLDQYRDILSEEGEIWMKTDNSSLFEYSILQMLQAGFELIDFSVDYRRDEHPEDAITEYERKFMEAGNPIYRSVWKKGRRKND